jgi:hypothetical protein
VWLSIDKYCVLLHQSRYTLTILLDSHGALDSSALRKLVSELTPSAEVLNSVGAELTFRLPFVESMRFGDLFDRMDGEKKQLGIQEYLVQGTRQLCTN